MEIVAEMLERKQGHLKRDADALYIVSGDKDLLVLEEFENIKIVTAKEFCEQYLD